MTIDRNLTCLVSDSEIDRFHIVELNRTAAAQRFELNVAHKPYYHRYLPNTWRLDVEKRGKGDRRS